MLLAKGFYGNSPSFSRASFYRFWRMFSSPVSIADLPFAFFRHSTCNSSGSKIVTISLILSLKEFYEIFLRFVESLYVIASEDDSDLKIVNTVLTHCRIEVAIFSNGLIGVTGVKYVFMPPSFYFLRRLPLCNISHLSC